jgi:hypothetical protein
VGRLGDLVGSAFLGVIGGYLGTVLSLGFFESAWGVKNFGVWVLAEALDRLSSPLIVAAVFGGILVGAATQKWWGALGGGFFLTIVGFYYMTFFLPQVF